jgi:hypothetical protein
MGLVQESNVNGIGPREQCEWDLVHSPREYRLLMTTHDRIQPVSGAHENLGHVALPAEPSAQVVDRPPACLPAITVHIPVSCLPACLLLRRSSGPPPGSLLSLSPPARACISELSLFARSLTPSSSSLPLSAMRSFFFCCIQFRSLVAAVLYMSASSS